MCKQATGSVSLQKRDKVNYELRITLAERDEVHYELIMMFGINQPESGDNQWRGQLDRFVKGNQQELAALAWGLWLANGDSQGTIGIDLRPTPHFVYCSQEAVEKLNSNVQNRLQEILGIIEHHQPEIEVLMIGIGKGEIKLIQFAPEPVPPVCFEQVGQDVDGLLDLLEQRMSEAITALLK